MNLVWTDPSAKFICCCWRNLWCDCHVTHTPKCKESAKIRANHELWLNNTDCLCVFPVPLTNYDTAQIWRCWQNGRYFYKTHLAFGNPAYVNQTILKIRKKLGGQRGSQAKIWGSMAHPGPPLESPLAVQRIERHLTVVYTVTFF